MKNTIQDYLKVNYSKSDMELLKKQWIISEDQLAMYESIRLQIAAKRLVAEEEEEKRMEVAKQNQINEFKNKFPDVEKFKEEYNELCYKYNLSIEEVDDDKDNEWDMWYNDTQYRIRMDTGNWIKVTYNVNDFVPIK
jgi:hypothetical protein